MMNISPLGDNVLVKQKKEEKTKSGIILTNEKELPEASVVAVGPGKMMDNGTRQAMDVKVGDTVFLKSWGGDKVEIEKEEYKIVSQGDILAIVK
jgi:chaperonin GroES